MGVHQDIKAKKNLIKTKLNVSEEGIITTGYGGIVILSESQDFVPIFFEDEFGNVHPVVMGSDRWEKVKISDATPTQGTLGEGTPDAP
tara:strand:+ start:1471 stop:1734 length:264 start_codon:yes stop_codon:yes gene_type:complete